MVGEGHVPGHDLERVTPQEAGIDGGTLAELVAEARQTASDGLVLLRDGKLVGEWYFDTPREPIEAMSVTKSVVSLAVGAALAHGKIGSLNDPLHTFFPELKQGRKEKITVRHVLANTSGIDAQRTTERIYASPDFVRFALAAELNTDPGGKFRYNNKAYNLLPAVIRSATGDPIDAFLRRALFEPLSIHETSWTKDEAGNCHGMAGLQIHPVDLAKLGQLLLDEGMHAKKRLLDPRYVTESIKPNPDANGVYGLGWWTFGERRAFIDDGVIEQWRAAGVDEEFISIVTPMKDKRFERMAFFAELRKAFDNKGGIQRWHQTTWKSGRPDGRSMITKLHGFYGSGYLGQHLVVLTEPRLVAVRMRRASSGGPDKKKDFKSFREMVQKLIAPTR